MPTDQKSATDAGEEKKDLVVTTAASWNKSNDEQPDPEDSFITELPSGNVVRMTRTMDMPLLLQQGRIPNPLAGIVQRMIDTRSTQFPREGADNKVVGQLLDLMHETIVKAIIEPPFDAPSPRGKWVDPKTQQIKKNETAEHYQDRLAEWKPKEGSVSVWDMTMEDRFFVFAVAQGAAADLATFRSQPLLAVADVQAGQGVRKPTKRTGGSGSKKKK